LSILRIGDFHCDLDLVCIDFRVLVLGLNIIQTYAELTYIRIFTWEYVKVLQKFEFVFSDGSGLGLGLERSSRQI